MAQNETRRVVRNSALSCLEELAGVQPDLFSEDDVIKIVNLAQDSASASIRMKWPALTPRDRILISVTVSAFLLICFIQLGFIVNQSEHKISVGGGGLNQSQASKQNHSSSSHVIRVLPFSRWDPAFTLPMNKNKRFIILITAFRTGSTFLGKLFDENPRVQYLFEPLHDAEIREMLRYGRLIGAGARHMHTQHGMLYLQQILHNCTVQGSQTYHEKWRFCGDAGENIARFGSEDCPPDFGRGRTVAGTCNFRHASVMKLIRLRRLKDLLLIRDIRGADVRIIHYTRHPLGVMTSRNLAGRFFVWNALTAIEGPSWVSYDESITRLAWDSYNYCTDATDVERTAQSDPWLRDRYLRITHRQLSLAPIATAELIYRHIDLELTPELVSFINRTTSGAVDPQEENELQPMMKTSRVSADVVTKWMKMSTLQHRRIKAVESVCRGLVEKTGEEISLDPFTLDEHVKLNHYPD